MSETRKEEAAQASLSLDVAKKRLRAAGEVLRRYGVASISIFGSVARGEARPDSDVDVLVEFAAPIGLFSVLRLERELEGILGHRVDVVTPAALKPQLRDRILEEAVRAA